KLRFTGTAVETVEAAVLARNVERGEVVKSSDVLVERRPKAEVGTDATSRDQNVTLIYETPGLYLTVRGKALEGGTEGDVVNVMNLQSKRTVSGTVTGRGQGSITPVAPRPPQTS